MPLQKESCRVDDPFPQKLHLGSSISFKEWASVRVEMTSREQLQLLWLSGAAIRGQGQVCWCEDVVSCDSQE